MSPRSRAPHARRSRLRLYSASLGALLVVLVAIGGPLLVQDPNAQDLGAALLKPLTSGHLLGTDQLGRDVLARTVTGLRSSLIICLLGLALAAVLGIPFGMISGYIGGTFDDIAMRLVDVQLAVPGIMLVLTVAAVLGPNMLTVVIVLGIAGWTVFARVARVQTLSLREREMVLAMHSVGLRHWTILLRHVLPNIVGPLIVIGTVELATLIMAEAALGYLGLGVPPPTPSLGGMVASGQSSLLAGAWWLVVIPGAALAIVIVAINAAGDQLRDVLDPRSRTSTLRRGLGGGM